MSSKPSLVERAAAVYDFNSGKKVGEQALPPARAPLQKIAPAAPAQPEPIATPAPQPAAAPVAQPQAAIPAPRRLARRAAAALGPQVEIDMDRLAKAGILTPDAPPSGLAEELRLIKRRLLSRVDEDEARGEPNARLILIASGQPGDGKTFTVMNLALSIARESDRNVLVVDGDTAKPDIAKRFGFEGGAGLVDLLTDPSIDPESLVVRTSIPSLAILPAGRRERNVPELLAAQHTDAVIAALLEADPSRIILIDSAPVLAASAAAVLAEQAAQTLVVVRADVTAEADLKETVELLSAAPHVSLLLNNAALKIGGRRYGRYEEYR